MCFIGKCVGGGCGEVLEEPGAGRKTASGMTGDEYAKYLEGLGVLMTRRLWGRWIMMKC